MKIGIITQPLHSNYGGLLQAFALQKVLRDMGHDVETDRFGAKLKVPFYRKVLRFCRAFLSRYLKKNGRAKNMKFVVANIERFVDPHISTIDFFRGDIKPSADTLNKFDAIVVGSDQVWRSIYNQYQPAYFLDFAKGLDIKRIAYAASFGKDDVNEYPLDILNKCKEHAPFFDAVSVREDSGVKICKDEFGVVASHVLDPTMLLDADDYLSVIEEEDKSVRKNVLMCYVLDKGDDKSGIIDKVANRLNLESLEVMPKKRFDASVSGDLTDYIYPSVSKWIAGFRDADFVVTDSFHGTVFSIIFNKPFIAIANVDRGASRFISLLKIFGLENRLVSSLYDVTDAHFEPIDYETVNQIKLQWQTKSRNFLINALK